MMTDQLLNSPSEEEYKNKILLLERRIQRELSARSEAESLLEKKSLELYKTNRELLRLNENLERSIRQRTKTLSSLIENLHTGILLEDENRNILLTNDTFRRIFNIDESASELVGTDFEENIHTYAYVVEDSESFLSRTYELIEARKKSVDETLKMKNGHVYARSYIPIYEGKEFVGHLWKYRDITIDFKYEEQTRKSEEKYRGIIENMELGLLEVDKYHKIIKAYDIFCNMIGYTQEELVGQNANDLLLPEKYQKLMAEQDTIREEGKPGVYEVELRRKNGEMIWVLISGAPFFDENGNQIGSIGIHYDITNRKKLEEELRDARKIAEDAREAEKQFLANMSHEIRNPINAITGMINLLYDTKLNTDQIELLDHMKYAGDILLGLISDVLDLSKIEAGKMELNNQEIDIRENVRGIVQTFRFKTNNGAVEFRTEIDPELNFPVLCDPLVFNQILLNLIGNAVKFTSQGHIDTAITLLEDLGDKARIKCCVRDTGIGIPKEQIGHIFESFRQADKETKLKFGGTGLGLSIVSRLVNLYDGEIKVESEPQKGSIFSFIITFQKGKSDTKKVEVKQPTSLSVPNQVKHVLVVEDNKFNQQYLTGLLKKWGITYDIANNGEEGLEWIKKGRYDLILMDIRMPIMDGYETTIHIRNSKHNPNCNVPIIALTASALVDEKEKALSAGMNQHLSKPFSPDQLLNILNLLEHQPPAPEPQLFEFSSELDKEYLDSFYEGDTERAQFMFEIFLSIIQQEIDSLNKFYSEKDWVHLESHAHKIKPNFLMVGLKTMTDEMVKIEATTRDQEFDALDQLMSNFNTNVHDQIALVQSEYDRIMAWET